MGVPRGDPAGHILGPIELAGAVVSAGHLGDVTGDIQIAEPTADVAPLRVRQLAECRLAQQRVAHATAHCIPGGVGRAHTGAVVRLSGVQTARAHLAHARTGVWQGGKCGTEPGKDLRANDAMRATWRVENCPKGRGAEFSLRGLGGVGGLTGGRGGLWGGPPPPSGDPELLKAPKAPKKLFGLN